MIRRLSVREQQQARPLSSGAGRALPPSPASPSVPALERNLARLLAAERALTPERIVRLVERELPRFRAASQVELRIHPHDRVQLPSAAELSARHALAAPLVITDDPALEPGGFLIRSSHGEVDARVSTQLERALLLLRGGA